MRYRLSVWHTISATLVAVIVTAFAGAERDELSGGATMFPDAYHEAVLGTRELYYLEQALRCIKMTPTDLLYVKNTHPDIPYRLPIIDDLMANPIRVPDTVHKRFSQIIESSQVRRYSMLASQLGCEALQFESTDNALTRDNVVSATVPAEYRRGFDTLPDTLRFCLAHLMQAFTAAKLQVDSAMESLPEAGQKNLQEHGGDFEAWEGYDEAHVKSLLLAGSRVFYESVEAAKALCRTGSDESAGKPPADFGLPASRAAGNILYYAKGPIGEIVVGGTGPNEYHGDFSLIIDLAGDDLYTGRAGGVDGRTQPPVALCIDLGGNNRFLARLKESSSKKDSTDMLQQEDDRIDYCFGGAIAGVGIMILAGEGDNEFAAGSWSMGAAFHGVGILLNTSRGNDIYESLDCSQGAASFGLGLLEDEAGRDRYKATYASQGFGSVFGSGTLIDVSGNDTFYAGGRYEDFPQRPKGSFIAMSQGFGYGIRPVCSGGLGALYDLEGDDFYHLDNQFGMGGSYWYGFGTLVDGKGSDRYQTGKDGDYDGYTMGAGIHLGIGCCIDKEGNDCYHANKIGPAVGWDFSPSWFIDEAGIDSFVVTAKDWNFGFAGVQNGCGFFIKKSGGAVYTGSGYFPSAQAERDCGSIGLMINIGQAQYTDADRRMQTNRWYCGESWGDKNTTWCAGLDVPKPLSETEIAKLPERETLDFWRWPARTTALPRFPADTLATDVDSISFRPTTTDTAVSRERLDTLWAACVAEEGSNWIKSDTARTRFRSLGIAALHYVIPKMASNNGYERRCAMTSVAQMGKAYPGVLAGHLALKDAVTKRRLILSMGNTGDTSTTIALLPFLKRRGYRLAAVEALGNLKDTRAVKGLLELATTDQFAKSEELRKSVAVALGRIADPGAVPLLVAMLSDSLYWGRYPAEQALIAIGDAATRDLMTVAASGRFPANVHAIEALGRIDGSQKGLIDLLVMLISDIDWAVRGYAVEALSRKEDKKSREVMLKRQETEAHPFVLGKLERALNRPDNLQRQ